MRIKRKEITKVIRDRRNKYQEKHNRIPYDYIIKREVLITKIALLNEVLDLIEHGESNLNRKMKR